MDMNYKTGKWVIGISGASGMRYALTLLNAMSSHNEVKKIHVVLSEAALRVLNEEEGIKLSPSNLKADLLGLVPSEKLEFHNPRDIGAPFASGSYLFDGMVVVPCSMSTLGAIANGVPQNLIHRAADVVIKENRKLILVPRETPLSAIHLENMLKLSRIGVSMLAAMPGFYHQPQSLQDLVNMMVLKIMDSMGLRNNLVERWGESETPSNNPGQSAKIIKI